MTDAIFYFDPRCPWCYQTSRWAKRLEELGELRLDWDVFSLEVLNLEEGRDPMELAGTGSPALRTAMTIEDAHGSVAIGGFYTELGARTFETDSPSDDQLGVIRASLQSADLDADLLDLAMADDTTWKRVVERTAQLHDRVGDVGVPTIQLDDRDGPVIFGPVIVSQPTDADAVELWRHTEWLTRYDNFAELKRRRSGRPDLPLMRWYAEQRRRREQADTNG